MPIAPGQVITASDLNAVWPTALNSLRSRTDDNNDYKQFTQTFSFNGVINTTPEYLRTAVLTPTTDLILREARIYIRSLSGGVAQNGIAATLTIPAQIIEDDVIVGGNIKRTLTTTCTSVVPSTDFSDSGATISLPNTELFTFLAGDNIDIIVSTPNATNNNYITVSLLFENILIT